MQSSQNCILVDDRAPALSRDAAGMEVFYFAPIRTTSRSIIQSDDLTDLAELPALWQRAAGYRTLGPVSRHVGIDEPRYASA